MSESSNELISKYQQIIENSTTVLGVLKNLNNLISNLKQYSATYNLINRFEKQKSEIDKEYTNNFLKCITWIQECFQQLKLSKHKNHTVIIEEFEVLEAILEHKPYPAEKASLAFEMQHQYYYSPSTTIGKLLNSLLTVASKIAEFGELELFKDWAKLDIYTASIKLDNLNSGTNISHSKKYTLSKLAELIGYGLVSYSFEKLPEKLIRKNKFAIVFRQYRITNLIIPTFISSIISSEDSKKNSSVNLDSDLFQLYNFITFLAQYDSISPFYAEANENNPWILDENNCLNLLAKAYLRGFASESPPYSLEDLKKIIKQFLLLLELELKIKPFSRKSTSNKQQASQFIQNQIPTLYDKSQHPPKKKT
ncbi:MAG TPA: hypothetical protein VL443_29890, partial [Cyclobacteriaceae bacterium]|nr:hypothetical protein [Cyclobacteriaceae bacterium]